MTLNITLEYMKKLNPLNISVIHHFCCGCNFRLNFNSLKKLIYLLIFVCNLKIFQKLEYIKQIFLCTIIYVLLQIYSFKYFHLTEKIIHNNVTLFKFNIFIIIH